MLAIHSMLDSMLDSMLESSLNHKTSSLKKTINVIIVILDAASPMAGVAVQQLRQTVRILDLAAWYSSTKAVFLPRAPNERQVLTRAKNTCSYVADSWANLKSLSELDLLDLERIRQSGSALLAQVSKNYPSTAFLVFIAVEPIMKGFTITANAMAVCEKIYSGEIKTWQQGVGLAGRMVDLTANLALFFLFPQGALLKKVSTVLLWVRIFVNE